MSRGMVYIKYTFGNKITKTNVMLLTSLMKKKEMGVKKLSRVTQTIYTHKILYLFDISKIHSVQSFEIKLSTFHNTFRIGLNPPAPETICGLAPGTSVIEHS